MKSISLDQAIMNAAVPENETMFFKISPPTTATADAWLLSPLPNGAGDNVTAAEFRVSFASNDELLAQQQERIAELPAKGSEFELKYESDLICFSGREIVLQCQASERDARLGLLKDFCRLYVRTETLEKKAGQLLGEAKQDTLYTGKVDQKLLPEFARLSEQNRKALLLRIEFAEIKREIAKAEEVSPDSKLLAELLAVSKLNDRIELLADEIEIAEEVYGVCVDRFSDFSYFWREYLAEIWIIVILVIELLEFWVDIALQVPKG